MKTVSIEEVRDGDVIARDLLHSNGSMVLAAGNRLTDSVIRRLQKIGIKQVSIEGQNDSASTADTARQLALLEERFAGTEGDVYLQEMKNIAAGHIQGS